MQLKIALTTTKGTIMTALAKRDVFETHIGAPESQDLNTGSGTELFVSGSAPAGTNLLSGEGTDLFVSGSAPAGTDMSGGDGTALYAISV